jgi:hypothetical protein
MGAFGGTEVAQSELFGMRVLGPRTPRRMRIAALGMLIPLFLSAVVLVVALMVIMYRFRGL